MRLIDADKLPVIRTFALVNDEKTEGGFAFAPIYCVMKGDLDNAPTVTIAEWKAEMPSYIKEAMLDALRPDGEWLYDDGRPQCPFCKTLAPFNDYDGFNLSNFCPECGADLRKGGNR